MLSNSQCATCAPVSAVLHDNLGRTIDYLRISLTDRCNLRCVYCMPENGVPSLDHHDILSLEEIERIVRIAAKRGIKHVRLTGGEPLVRKGISDLIRKLKQIPEIESIALTTNGILLPTMASELKEAGLDRVNISLDSLDPAQYHAITRRGNLDEVLTGIEVALKYFNPVKINVVVVRHLQQDLLSFAQLTREKPLHVRFIEYMPIGNTQDYLPPALYPCPCSQNTIPESDNLPWTEDDVVPTSEILQNLRERIKEKGWGDIIPLNSSDDNKAPCGWGPASYMKINGAQGTIGFISAMSNHFCASCNRIRLTADGKLRPCLFSDTELDFKSALRKGKTEDVEALLDEALRIKPEGHHNQKGTRRAMSKIGG